MATITIVSEWRYEVGLSKSIGNDATHSYFNGAGYNGNYHVAVYKCYTDKTIVSPKLKLRGITDATKADRYLGAYFVSCGSEDSPSSSLTANSNALSGKYQTRIRFGYDFTGSFSDGSWESNSTVYGSGTCQSSITIPAGYFFVYIGTGTGSSYTNWSTFGASTNTKTGYAPEITATDAPTYTITYNANGGSGSTSSQTVIQGETTQLRSNEFTAPSTRLYTVTLNGNGGNNGTPTYDSPVNKFYRWIKDSASGTTYYNEGADFKPEANTTFYAQWYTPTIMGTTTRDDGEADGYTVNFDANGGSCTTTSLVAKDRVKYSFNNWNSKSDGTGSSLNSTSTYIITYSRTIYAQWIPNQIKGSGSVKLPTATYNSTSTLTVTLDYQGGKGSTTSKNSTKTITKQFRGWGTSKTANAILSDPYTPSGDQKTLYAIWGTASVSYTSFDLPTPTKVGYKFLGWATSASATSGVTGSYTPTSDNDTILYAIWDPDGNIRLYYNSTDKYKIALVYVYAPSSTSDTKPWKLAIPYLYTSGTQPWKIVAG